MGQHNTKFNPSFPFVCCPHCTPPPPPSPPTPKCWCGSASADYAKHGQSTGCTYECPGNPDDTCGGFYAANVYAYTTDDSTPAPTVTTPGTSDFLGCFVDKQSDRIMELTLSDGDSMTQEVKEFDGEGFEQFMPRYCALRCQ